MTRRPLGIWVVAVAQILLAVSVIAAALLGDDLDTHHQGEQLVPAARAVYGVWGIAVLVAAGLLLALRRRGWVACMVLVGLGLLVNLGLWWAGEANYLRMLLQAIAALYLNSAAVRALFQRASALDQPTGDVRHPSDGAGQVGLDGGMSVGDDADPLPGDDLGLLRAFEPVIRYNDGELFYPAPIDGYLAACDLLMGRSESDRWVVVPRGQVTAEVLGAYVAPPGLSLYLRLVQEPLGGLDLARWRSRPGRPRFQAPGRLARVGLFGRLVDAGFNLTLLLRGTVPGGTTAAAQVTYDQARMADPRSLYYGRVVRRDGWIVLHYLYFYFMNDYRSTFHGANDHEADWEQVFIYLTDDPTGPRAEWLAAAAHDYHGDQLRRRWDDPTLSFVGRHPVLYAGAGSHASYFERGEYLTSVTLPAAKRVVDGLEAARRLWVESLRQADPGDVASSLRTALSASFVDYARGDGVVIGEGGDRTWSALV